MRERTSTDAHLSIQSSEFAWDVDGHSEAHDYLLAPVLSLLSRHGARQILDLGCGNGSLSSELTRSGIQVTGLDFSHSGIERARRNFPQVHFEQHDVSQPIHAIHQKRFDAVVSTEVIEHLLLPRTLMHNALAALKPGGLFIATTPFHGYWKNLALALTNNFDEHWHPLRDHGHVKFFSRRTLTRLFLESGFTDLQFLTAGRIPLLAKSMILAGTGAAMISVIVLTKNEEQDLPGCLESVRWSDDIHVYDSLSTDRTLEIARAAGARVTQRAFDNWAAHQNWGLRNLPFRHSWVFYIDADERVTPELQAALLNAVRNPGGMAAFRVQRRDFLLDTWLKHVQTSALYIRLFQPQLVRYERLVNPVTLVDGPVGQITGFLDHFPFSKGMTHWMARHNSYSSLEAQQIRENRSQRTEFSLRKAFFDSDFNERRYHQKELFYRLPARPLLKFLLLYLGKRGFLDGRAGLTYATLQSLYEYMIVLKTRELDGRGAEEVS